jgi:flagella basal body P-ring formation protein FlgA
MKRLFSIVFVAVCGLAVSAATAAAIQDNAEIRNTVVSFVKLQIAALPGKVSYKVDDIDRRIAMPACNRLEAFLPSGSQFIGRTSIGVRCMETNGWSIFVPVQIKISMHLLVSARQLPTGHVLQAQDLTSQTIEISRSAGLSDVNQALGKVLRYGIAAGQMLREDMLRQPFSVKQGQIVQLLVQGDAFSIRSEGAALANASIGQTVNVRSSSGRVVGGIAQANGVVEIGP